MDKTKMTTLGLLGETDGLSHVNTMSEKEWWTTVERQSTGMLSGASGGLDVLTWLVTLVPEEVERKDVVTASAQAACDLYKFVMGTVLMGTMCIFGSIGNIISILVFATHFKDKSGTSFLLSTLAWCDLAVLLTLFLMKTVPSFLKYVDIGQEFFKIYPYFLVYGWPSVNLSNSLALWVTVLVCSHRFFAVCYPILAAQVCTVGMVQKVTAVTMFLVILVSLPLYFDYYPKTVHNDDNTTRVIRAYTQIGESDAYHLWYRNIFYYVFFYIIPLSILAMLTFRLVRELRRVRKFQVESMSTKASGQDNINTTMIAIVIITMICRVWNPIRRLLEMYLEGEQGCGHFYFYYAEMPSLSSVVSSFINFLLYCFLGSKFRSLLQKKLCGHCLRKVSKRARSEAKKQNVSDTSSSTDQSHGRTVVSTVSEQVAK